MTLHWALLLAVASSAPSDNLRNCSHPAILLNYTIVGDKILSINKVPGNQLLVGTPLVINQGGKTEEVGIVTSSQGVEIGEPGRWKVFLRLPLSQEHYAGEEVTPLDKALVPGRLIGVEGKQRKEYDIAKPAQQDQYYSPPTFNIPPPTPWPTQPPVPTPIPCDPSTGRLCGPPSTGGITSSTGVGTLSSDLEASMAPKLSFESPLVSSVKGVLAFDPSLEPEAVIEQPEGWNKGVSWPSPHVSNEGSSDDKSPIGVAKNNNVGVGGT